MACVRVCPADAVAVEGAIVRIVDEACTRCGLCLPACPHDAIEALGDVSRALELALAGRAALILSVECAAYFYPAAPNQVVNACYAAGFRTVHRGVLEALAYARSLQPNRLLAVTVVSDEEEQERIEREWADRKIDVPLEIVHSPYRELTRPILRYIDELDARYDNDIITVVIPEFVVGSWWGQLLHNQSALMLKARLLFRKGTVVTSVPYHLQN